MILVTECLSSLWHIVYLKFKIHQPVTTQKHYIESTSVMLRATQKLNVAMKCL